MFGFLNRESVHETQSILKSKQRYLLMIRFCHSVDIKDIHCRQDHATVENVKGCNELALLVPNAHLLVEQTSEFDDSPGQYFPPCNGTGLSHFRVLDLKPSPHVTLHVDQSDQRPQLPSTAEHKTK